MNLEMRIIGEVPNTLVTSPLQLLEPRNAPPLMDVIKRFAETLHDSEYNYGILFTMNNVETLRILHQDIGNSFTKEDKKTQIYIPYLAIFQIYAQEIPRVD